MSIIASISGIRGTIGGKPGEALTPLDLVKYAAAYGTWIAQQHPKNKRIVLGRDARISGEMVRHIVVGTLQSVGVSVIDIGLATTPTVEMAIPDEQAAGGIILSASHNPKQWNALKLLNNLGEFISDADGQAILQIIATNNFDFVSVDHLGSYETKTGYLDKHINKILALPLVDVAAIKKSKFKILVDGINSVGGIAIPALLRALGVEQIVEMYCTPDGKFAHNPEPLPENLATVSMELKRVKADLGIVVDPDADRLAIINEDGTMFGEEYTLVAVADYVLQNKKGTTVSNLSSTRTLKEITEKMGCQYHAAAVGEVNVVAKMKEVNAIIGGEGNGGIIYPELHYGRDALVGVALFLSYLAKFGKSCSTLRQKYPNYYMYKGKIELSSQTDIDLILQRLRERYKNQPMSTIDGVRIEFNGDWIHLRKSNTEPIVRIYAESSSQVIAEAIVKQIHQEMRNFLPK